MRRLQRQMRFHLTLRVMLLRLVVRRWFRLRQPPLQFNTHLLNKGIQPGIKTMCRASHQRRAVRSHTTILSLSTRRSRLNPTRRRRKRIHRWRRIAISRQRLLLRRRRSIRRRRIRITRRLTKRRARQPRLTMRPAPITAFGAAKVGLTVERIYVTRSRLVSPELPQLLTVLQHRTLPITDPGVPTMGMAKHITERREIN